MSGEYLGNEQRVVNGTQGREVLYVGQGQDGRIKGPTVASNQPWFDAGDAAREGLGKNSGQDHSTETPFNGFTSN